MARTPWNLRHDAHIPTESEFHKLSLEIGLCSQIFDRYPRNGIRLGSHKDNTRMRDLFTKNGASLGHAGTNPCWAIVVPHNFHIPLREAMGEG